MCVLYREPLLDNPLLVPGAWEQLQRQASEEAPAGEKMMVSGDKQQDTPTEPETTNDSSGEDELGGDITNRVFNSLHVTFVKFVHFQN